MHRTCPVVCVEIYEGGHLAQSCAVCCVLKDVTRSAHYGSSDDVPSRRPMALAAFDSERQQLATVSVDGLLAVWDAASSALVQQHARPTHLAVQWTCIAWRPSADGGRGGRAGGFLALGADSGAVILWDLQLGRIVKELRGHTQAVTDVAFESTGQSLFSCALDRQVLVWSLPGGQLLHTYAAGQAAVQRLLPTSSGEHLLLASSALRLVRRDTWKRAGKVPGHASRVTCLCMSPDSQLAASSASDRHVSIWRVSPSALSAAESESGESSPCVQTLALETTIVQLAFAEAEAEAGDEADGAPPTSYMLLALSAAGVVSVWRLDAAAVFPPKGKKMRKPRSGGAAAGLQPLLPAIAPCQVQVASPATPAAEAKGRSVGIGGGMPAPGDHDPQRIFQATFTAGGRALLVAYGSQVKPTLVTTRLAHPDGTWRARVELPRLAEGLFAEGSAAAGSAGGKAAAKAKRSREASLLGAMDTALPAMGKRRAAGAEGVGSAPDDDKDEEESAAAALATAASPADKGAAPNEGEEGEEVSLDIGGLPTFGQRLAALEAGAPNGDASGLGANGGARNAAKRQPTTASQVSLLVQSLQNGDAAMLDEALQTQDAATITSTVARLPTNVVLPFLEAVLYRVQGKPARVASLASWLRALLAQHAAYLMACPTLLPMLTPLYQLIDERLAAFKPLLKLVGRMQMLQSQLVAQQAASRSGQSHALSDPALTFDEGLEEEEAAARGAAEEGEDGGEEEDEDEDEGEDDEDDDDDDDDEDLEGEDDFGMDEDGDDDDDVDF